MQCTDKLLTIFWVGSDGFIALMVWFFTLRQTAVAWIFCPPFGDLDVGNITQKGELLLASVEPCDSWDSSLTPKNLDGQNECWAQTCKPPNSCAVGQNL